MVFHRKPLVPFLSFLSLIFYSIVGWIPRNSNHHRSRIDIEMKTKGIYFDVDGTLSDSFQLGFSSTQQVLQRNGYELITEDAYHQGTRFTTPRRLAWHTTGNPDDFIGEKLGKEFDDLYVALVSTETTPLYDGIRELLSNLVKEDDKNSDEDREVVMIKLAALSNACGDYVKSVMKVHHLDSIFQLVLGADEVPYAKPRPEGLLMICKRLGIEPEDCVYIGDSPSDGIAAKQASMKSIGVSWGSHSVETISPNFDKVVHNVQELHSELQRFINSS